MNTLSAREKWSYAIGNVPFSVKETAFANFVVFYYTQVNGLSGSLAGLAMFMALVWDAISDPIVGSWSDNFRSRWGRRHPLLVAGALPTTLLFLGLFAPPSGLSEMGIFAWLLAISILLRTALTIYFVPYTAMGAELSTDYDQRTTIAKARITLGWVAAMALPAIAYTIYFQPQNGVDGRLVAENYWHFGVLSAAVAGVTALICIMGTRSVIPRLPVGDMSKRFSWSDPYNDLKTIFINRNFRVSIGSNLAFGMTTGAYATLSLYLATYFWELTTAQLAGLVVPTAMATLLAFVGLGGLSRRFDKPKLLAAFSLGLAVNSLWLFGGRLFDLLPANGEPLLYLLIAINTGIGVLMIVSLQIISASFGADTLDELELQTGKRQEGVLFSVGAFLSKATIGAGALVAGIVIDLVGIQSTSLPGQVPADVLQSLGWFTLVITVGFALIGFYFTTQLRLSRDDHARMRDMLDVKAINRSSAATN
jgi:Na+/melibiose symporter-like transporter|tara:strand:- start:1149 stop:2585 length:1437 start_codon:yes stop_codon:yes gene_type:complete